MLLLMLSVTNVQSVAQETYRDLLKVMCEKGMVSNLEAVDGLKEQYYGMMPAGQKGRILWRIIIDEYFRAQYRVDIVDVLMPYFERHLTLDELKEIVVQIDTPEFKKSMQNLDNFIGVLDDPYVAKYIENSVDRIVSGRKIAIPEDSVPQNYKGKFNEMWNVCQMDTMIGQIVRTIDERYARSVPTKTLVRIGQFFTGRELKNVMTNVMYGCVDESDLDFMIKFHSSSIGEKYTKLTKDMVEDAEQLGINIASKFQQWVEKISAD